MTNSPDQFRLTPEAKQNLVDFFIVLQEIKQEKELEERLSNYSLTHLKNE